MTEQQWKYVIDSPRFKRFSQEYGFKVGSVDADGNYRPGKQDYRAVAALVRAEAGRKVVGTPDRMERTLAAFNVQGGATPDGYAWEDGKFRVGPDGAYLRPEDGASLDDGSHDEFLFTDAKGNGYVRHPDGSLSWLNPGTGTTTPIRSADGKWLKGDPKKMQANFDADVAAQEKEGLSWRLVADADGGAPLDAAEVARRVGAEGGVDTITDEPGKVRAGPSVKDFQVVDAGPQGTHAIYGRVLPHKPTDDDDTVRISTIGGVKVLHRTTDPTTGEDVWQAEGDTQFTLPGGATVLSGGGTRTTLKERVQANRGARDERKAREAAGAMLPEQPSAPEPPTIDKAHLIASMEAAAAKPKAAPYVAPEPPPDVEPGSPEALQYLKQKRLDEVKQALIQTMSGNPTLPPGKTLPQEEAPAPAPAEQKQRALVAALMRQKQASAAPAGG